MFEHFTPDARHVIAQTYVEARRLDHDYVGTEHLVLALSRIDGAPGSLLRERSADHAALDHAVRTLLGLPPATDDRAALAALGIDLDEVKAVVEATFGSGALDAGKANTSGPVRRSRGGLPFTRRAKKTLSLGLQHANREGQRVITPLHLLLGVLDEGQGLGCKALVECGVDLAALRTSALALAQRAA